MKKIEDFMIFRDTRPILATYLDEHGREAWIISETTFGSERKDCRGILLLLVEKWGVGGREIVASMPIRRGKLDWYLRWPIYEFDPDRYLVMDKKKMGRPRRQLTDQEKDKILAMRAEGLSINAIAKEMRVNNKVIMKFCRILLALNEDDNALEIGRRLYEEVKPGKTLDEVCIELHIDMEPAKKFLEDYKFWFRNKDQFKKLRERLDE